MTLLNSRRQDAGGQFGKSGRRLPRIASHAKQEHSRCSLAFSGWRPPPWMRSRRVTEGERSEARAERDKVSRRWSGNEAMEGGTFRNAAIHSTQSMNNGGRRGSVRPDRSTPSSRQTLQQEIAARVLQSDDVVRLLEVGRNEQCANSADCHSAARRVGPFGCQSVARQVP